MRIGLWGTLFILAAAVAPLHAHAHDAERWDPPGSFIFEIEGGYEHVNVPTIEATEPGETDDSFGRWTTGVTIGFVDLEGLTLPDPFGENARIELRGSYASGKGDNDRGDDSYNFRGIDGSAPDVIAVGSLNTATDFETWEAELRYTTDVRIHDHVAVSPFVGIAYLRHDFDNDFRLSTGSQWDDNTRTHAGGLVLGGDLVYRPTHWLGLSTGLQVDLMGADAHTKVTQDAGVHAGLTEYDSDTSFLARTRFNLGMSFGLGPAILAVEGFVRYESYFAKVDYPLPSDPTPANIDPSEMWAAGGRANLSIGF